ncbi:hypothetical protein [Clostridium sp.]|uniref:hypothetical protein n=1 Tax=Clostridium sp. TaxID=1506 RepID=UPI001A46C3F0|nr:hypothetical protein [Clostridium sp.]MBK5239812.1 hypothetical protein [Clostridium sp.]
MSRTLTYEFVKNYIEVESKSNCKLISTEYVNNHTFLDIQCSCGNTFHVGYDAFRNCNVRTCNECSNKIRKTLKPRKSYNDIKEYIEITSNSGCILLTIKEDYKNKKQKIELQCACGDKFDVSFENFERRNKRKCNKCSFSERANKAYLSYATVKEDIEGKNGNGCTLISTEYIDAHTNLNIKCACGNMYSCTINDFISDKHQKQCGECSKKQSKGEVKIKRYLANNHILFKEQFMFSDCKDILPLRFDFAILNDNSTIIKLIEFDGQQHFKPVRFGGVSTEKALISFNRAKSNDDTKDNYCSINDIPLLRIPYWDFKNIKSILDNEFQIDRKEVGRYVVA